MKISKHMPKVEGKKDCQNTNCMEDAVYEVGIDLHPDDENGNGELYFTLCQTCKKQLEKYIDNVHAA